MLQLVRIVHTRCSILCYLVALFVLSPDFCFSAPLRVGMLGNYEKKEIDVRVGQVGKIQVYLMSAGEELSGYQVSLFRNADAQNINTRVSDDHGLIEFVNVAPDDYTLILRRTQEMKNESTVSIGDVLLSSVNPVKATKPKKVVKSKIKKDSKQ